MVHRRVTSDQQELHTWDLKMKEATTVNRRDLLLGATPAATLMVLGAATRDSARAADDCRGLCADVFQSR